jgi:hypothetical protein
VSQIQLIQMSWTCYFHTRRLTACKVLRVFEIVPLTRKLSVCSL